MPKVAKALALRKQEERARRAKLAAVNREFGGRKKTPMLVPEDDPTNNALVLRLAQEVLFLRDRSERRRHQRVSARR